MTRSLRALSVATLATFALSGAAALSGTGALDIEWPVAPHGSVSAASTPAGIEWPAAPSATTSAAATPAGIEWPAPPAGSATNRIEWP